MIIYITNVFKKKSQVDIYAKEGFLFHFANATFRSDKCVIVVITVWALNANINVICSSILIFS